MFASVDDIKGVRDTAKLLCRAVEIKPHPTVPFLCSHPYTQNTSFPVWESGSNAPARILELTNPKDYEEWEKMVFEKVDNMSIGGVFALTDKPYRLTLLKYIKEYLTRETFSELFGEAWVMTENPNGDVNCSLAELARWFKQADKRKLMDEKEFAVWEQLPEEFVVYRGVAVGRKPMGLSWTRNIETAKWFASRFDRNGKVGYVQKATIKKKFAYAYFNGRGEDEVVVDSAKIKEFIEIIE